LVLVDLGLLQAQGSAVLEEQQSQQQQPLERRRQAALQGQLQPLVAVLQHPLALAHLQLVEQHLEPPLAEQHLEPQQRQRSASGAPRALLHLLNPPPRLAQRQQLLQQPLATCLAWLLLLQPQEEELLRM
jgi:hypothetical protein